MIESGKAGVEGELAEEDSGGVSGDDKPSFIHVGTFR